MDENIVGALLAILGDQGKKQFEQEAWRHRDTDIKYVGKEITTFTRRQPPPNDNNKKLPWVLLSCCAA